MCFRASQVTLAVKNLPVDAGDIRDAGFILGLRGSPGEGNDNPLQYYPMNSEARQATVQGVAKSWTQLK